MYSGWSEKNRLLSYTCHLITPCHLSTKGKKTQTGQVSNNCWILISDKGFSAIMALLIVCQFLKYWRGTPVLKYTYKCYHSNILLKVLRLGVYKKYRYYINSGIFSFKHKSVICDSDLFILPKNLCFLQHVHHFSWMANVL